MKKIKDKENVVKRRKKTIEDNKDKKKLKQQLLIKEIQENAHKELLPSLKEKMVEVADYITKRISDGEELNSTQIMSLIAKKSLVEIASGSTITYTPQEIAVSFNYYLEMIDKINKIKKFPPTLESFCVFMGITPATYNNWLSSPDKKNIMDYIHGYLIGAINTSTLIKEVETIAGIYTTKTMGKIEQQSPMVIEHKKVTDVSSIKAQIDALKKDNVIDAEFEEVSGNDN